MTAINHINRSFDSQNNFNTIQENRRLRIVEPEHKGGLRNFKYSEGNFKAVSSNSTIFILKLAPWLIAGLILVLSIFV